MDIRFSRTDNENIHESRLDEILADYNPVYGKMEDWHWFDSSATIQLNSLEELTQLFVRLNEELIILPHTTTNELIDIEIYDAYRE